MRLALTLLLWIVALPGRSPLAAADWPQWRGAARDGRWSEPGLDAPIPPGGFTVLWHASVGFGFSSPVVADGRVFVTDSQFVSTNRLVERALCFDFRSGREVWSHSFDGDYADWARDPKNAFGPRPTPVVDRGRIFVLGARGQLWCLDAGTGAVIWNRQLPNKNRDSVYTASPLVEGERLMVSMDGGPDGESIIALDARTGRDGWRALSDPPTLGSPVVIEAAGRRQLIVWTSHAVNSLEPSTGATWWQVRHPGGLTYPVASPVWEAERLLVGGLLLRLDMDKPGATVVWPESGPPSRQAVSETSLPVLEGDRVFTANAKGELVCLDARDGHVVWSTNGITKASSGAGIQITAVGGRHVLLNDWGELIWANLDAGGYRELSRNRFVLPTSPMGPNRHFWTPPAFAHGCIVARNDEELICARLVPEVPAGSSPTGAVPQVVELWPGQAPDEIGSIGPERLRMSPRLDRTKVEVTESTRLITGVSKPTMAIHRPAPEHDTGTVVLICPGGGYWDLYWQLEGEEVAGWLNSIGVTGVILKYRVPRRAGEVEKEPARRPLQDAQRAIRLIRSRGRDFGLQVERVGIMGFSAGGHLALAAATQFGKPSYADLDAVDAQSPRPDFAVPVYAGYLKDPGEDEMPRWMQVPEGTPPCFLVHGTADIISAAEGSLLAYRALVRVGTPAELHLYAGAAHDFGVRTNAGPAGGWTKVCEDWMRQNGWIRAQRKE